MSREKMIEQKMEAIDALREEINLLSRLESNRLYHIKDTTFDSHAVETWGYIVSFNKLTVRFRIIASDNPFYRHRIRHYTQSNRWTGRSNIKNVVNFRYVELYRSGKDRGRACIPAKKDDLPLLIGLKYKFPELDLILRGKKKVLLDA